MIAGPKENGLAFQEGPGTKWFATLCLDISDAGRSLRGKGLLPPAHLKIFRNDITATLCFYDEKQLVLRLPLLLNNQDIIDSNDRVVVT